MFRSLSVIIVLLIITSCSQKKPTAQTIVDKAIEVAGGNTIANTSMHFKFRDLYYRATRHDGLRTLERCTDAACQVQQDVIKANGEFIRFRESAPTLVPDSMKVRYANSVNSVHYFSVLPYGLNDLAVTKKLVDEVTVKGKPYYRILVTFAQDGGGQDFQDEYMYWIHKENYTVDYLAYNYQTSEGGTRFREAYNERIIEGVRFVDYRNYKPDEQFPALTTLDNLFESDKLHLLSKIELENITVTACVDNC